MAKKTKKIPGQSTWRKKKWHKIVAPEFLRSTFIGETPTAEPENLVGKTTKVNLMNITRNMKDQNINVTFEVTKLTGDTASTQIKQLQMVPASVKRVVKRGKNRLDDSFVCLTADSKHVRIKPLIITNNSTTKPVQTAMRKKMVDFYKKKVVKINYDVFCQEVITKKFQKALRETLSKVYPLRICEVRAFVLLSEEAIKREEVRKRTRQASRKTQPKKEEVVEEETEDDADEEEFDESEEDTEEEMEDETEEAGEELELKTEEKSEEADEEKEAEPEEESDSEETEEEKPSA